VQLGKLSLPEGTPSKPNNAEPDGSTLEIVSDAP